MDKSLEEVDHSIFNLCRLGNIEEVMKLIDEGADPLERDDDERLPLHWAASSKNSELVSYLISLSKNYINAIDDSKYTPLMCAVSSGREENVRLLIEAGADVNVVNDYGETVLHMVKQNNTILSLFIDKIEDINKKNDYGLTALMKAASLGCLDIMTALLEHASDMYITDSEGNTAAHYAAFDNRREAYLLLKKYGFDEETKNKAHKTPLDYVLNIC